MTNDRAQNRYLLALHKVDDLVRAAADARENLSGEELASAAERLELAAELLGDSTPIISHPLTVEEIVPMLEHDILRVVVKVSTEDLLDSSDYYIENEAIQQYAANEQARNYVDHMVSASIVAANESHTYVEVVLVFESRIKDNT